MSEAVTVSRLAAGSNAPAWMNPPRPPEAEVYLLMRYDGQRPCGYSGGSAPRTMERYLTATWIAYNLTGDGKTSIRGDLDKFYDARVQGWNTNLTSQTQPFTSESPSLLRKGLSRTPIWELRNRFPSPLPNPQDYRVSVARDSGFAPPFLQIKPRLRTIQWQSDGRAPAWSRSLDNVPIAVDASNFGNAGIYVIPINLPNYAALDKGPSDFNRGRVASISYVWQIPALPNGNRLVRK